MCAYTRTQRLHTHSLCVRVYVCAGPPLPCVSLYVYVCVCVRAPGCVVCLSVNLRGSVISVLCERARARVCVCVCVGPSVCLSVCLRVRHFRGLCVCVCVACVRTRQSVREWESVVSVGVCCVSVS